MIPLFDFDYTGVVEIEKFWSQKYDLSSLPEDYSFFDKNIRLKSFEINRDYPEMEMDFFSPYEKRCMQESKWCISITENEANHTQYSQYINLLLIAFRVYFDSQCYIKYKFSKANPNNDIKLLATFLKIPSSELGKRIFNKNELAKVDNAFSNIVKLFDQSFRARHALDFMFLGFTEYYALSRFILLMTSIESFYLPSKKSWIKETLKERIPKFLNNQAIENYLDDIYKIRSDITHGKLKTDLYMKEFLPKVLLLQNILTETLKKIFDGNLIDIYKDESTKEEYFASLFTTK